MTNQRLNEQRNAHSKAFQYTLTSEAERRICEHVALRIERTRIAHLRINAGILTTIAVGTAVGFVPTIEQLSTQAYTSGFSGYASIFLSDTSYTFSNIKVLLMSLAESIPLANIALALALLIICGLSLKGAAQQVSATKRAQSHSFA